MSYYTVSTVSAGSHWSLLPRTARSSWYLAHGGPYEIWDERMSEQMNVTQHFSH